MLDGGENRSSARYIQLDPLNGVVRADLIVGISSRRHSVRLTTSLRVCIDTRRILDYD